MIRDGFAWVGVSAQSSGVSSLQAADPDRYGSLSHPGDSYSYDILSQAGQVLRKPTNSHALGGLEAKRVIAAGTSQSAFRLVTYVNAVHPLTKAFDGFLIRSRRRVAARPCRKHRCPLSAPRTRRSCEATSMCQC